MAKELILAPDYVPYVDHVLRKRADVPPVKEYHVKDLILVKGDTFLLITPELGVIDSSKYFISTKLGNHFKEIEGVESLRGEYFLMGNFKSDNYLHWVFQCFASLLLAIENGLDLENTTILTPPMKGFMKEYLDLLPFDLNIKELEPKKMYLVEDAKFNNILWRGFTDDPNRLIVNIFDRYKENITLPVSPCGKRLFVGRHDADIRNVYNEKEVAKMLQDYGFEYIVASDYSVLEQMAIFNEAEFIVGVHGAALTNLLFANDPIVVELFQSNWIHRGFWAMSESKDYSYTGIGNNILHVDKDGELVEGQHNNSEYFDFCMMNCHIPTVKKTVEDLLNMNGMPL